jgi:hypothetical protein
MSIHANPTPEAQERLQRQRRASAISSFFISVLTLVLVGLLLALVLIPGIVTDAPLAVIYTPPETKIDVTPTAKDLTIKPMPAAPPMSSARVIVSATSAPVSFDVPDVSLEFDVFGTGTNDFGADWTGSGDHNGAAGGGGGFGSSDVASGGLAGKLYDFKQSPDGDEIRYDLADRSGFVDRVLRLQRSRFSASSLRRHFEAPGSLYLTHLAIPDSNASAGPEYFGARDSIKPSGWMAHYSGRVVVPKSGSYRFSGLGDDYLVLMINGRERLVACWGDIQQSVAGRWEPGEPSGRFASPMPDMKLVFGDWINLKAGDVIDLNLAIGERPGGKVGFVLHVEEKGVEYRKAADGRPILPLFTTAPFPDEERARLTAEFGAYEFEWENVPVFRLK